MQHGCLKHFLSFLILLAIVSTVHAKNTNTAVGFWNTINDETHHVNSIVQIWETPDKTLAGKIVKSMPGPNEKVIKFCDLCKGANYNKPIVGLVFMWGFKFDGDKWTGGKILDARSGKIYRAHLKTDNNGHLLKVHGYIGLPLFGVTKVWERNGYF